MVVNLKLTLAPMPHLAGNRSHLAPELEDIEYIATGICAPLVQRYGARGVLLLCVNSCTTMVPDIQLPAFPTSSEDRSNRLNGAIRPPYRQDGEEEDLINAPVFRNDIRS